MVQSRPFRGSSRTTSPFTTVLSVEDERAMSAVAATTSTFSSTEEICMRMFATTVLPTSTDTPSCTAVANPVAATVRS